MYLDKVRDDSDKVSGLRCFSINKCLSIYGANLSENAFLTLQLVKDCLLMVGNLSKVKITKELSVSKNFKSEVGVFSAGMLLFHSLL